MQRRQIIVNAVMVVTQIVVIGFVLFILYRFLLRTIGIEHLGIWSLVLATTSVTQIASFGLSGSIVKFVAKYTAREEADSVSKVIQTAAISVAVFVAFILVTGYPIVKLVLGLVIPATALSLAFSILPFAFLAMWIMIITSIFQAGLDGFQRVDLRSFLLMSSAVMHLLLCFLLAPRYGLMGLAYAKVVQNIVVLIASWFLLKMHLSFLPTIPYQWNKNMFKEIIGYGINFQIISVTTMFYDPITKALLGRFGGLSLVGYYEMASKLVHQFRALIVSVNQVLVPTIAGLHEESPGKIRELYLTSYRLLFYLAVPTYSLLIICAPIISILWIGSYENTFVLIVILLSIGWYLNTLNAPAYYANLGIGILRWNLISHISIALLNASLGFLLGILFGGRGVVLAWVISLALGSSIIYLSYHVSHKIPLIELLPRASRIITLVCFVSVLSARVIYCIFAHGTHTIALNGVILLLFLVIMFIPFWFHPMRKRVIGWIANDFFNIQIHAS